jgi:3-oxoacyl-[acyl-carrier-protein] synthase II
MAHRLNSTAFEMARIQPSQLVVTGTRALVVAPGAALTPERWAGAPARLARMDRLCALALVACDGALLDAGLAPTAPEWHGERTAVVFGTAYGCHATNEDYYRGLLREGPAGASPRLFAYTLPSSPVGEVSIHYGIRGPATALGNGLTSGLDALGEGVAQLRSGRADRVLVCAADVATPLLSRLLASAGDVEPLFAAPALVDGAAALLLERAADAAARGATPRARVLAGATTFQAGARAAAVSAAIAQVLAEADVAAAAVRRLLAAPADAAVARTRGIDATSAGAASAGSDGDYPSGALGAATLVALARALAAAGDAGLTLLVAGDDGGAGAAALVASG